jgi:hypothetical protein
MVDMVNDPSESNTTGQPCAAASLGRATIWTRVPRHADAAQLGVDQRLVGVPGHDRPRAQRLAGDGLGDGLLSERPAAFASDYSFLFATETQD